MEIASLNFLMLLLMLRVVVRKALIATINRLAIAWRQNWIFLATEWNCLVTAWSQVVFCSFHANAPNSQVLLSMFSFSCSCLTRWYLSFFFLFVCFSSFFLSECGVGAAGWEDLWILSPGGFSVEWNWMQTVNKLKENFISTSEGISHWSWDEAGA